MAEKTHILAFDNGTQSVRALLFDLKGNLTTKVQIQLEPYFSEQPGWAEQKAAYFWENLCRASQALWSETDVPKEAVAGVAVTTQRACVINLDRDGKPLRPMISWLDQRRAKSFKPIGGMTGLLFKLAGAEGAIRYLQGESEANWLAENQPEIWENTHKYLLLSGYHIFRLTGHYRDSASAQVGFLPFDFKRLNWCGKRSWMWQLAPIRREMLPDLVQPGEQLGVISAEASEQTGIPAGMPVIAAGTDKGCEILGAGCLDQRIGSVSYGTTATINTISKKYLEVTPRMPPYPAPVPNEYCTEIMIYRGYWMVNWFKKQFALREQQIAEKNGVEPETLFDDLVKAVPPGSMGLTLQPYWSPGLSMPEAKGAIIGFGDVHTRAHIYRAILEGLAYGLREGKERIEKRSGVKMERLMVAGGGSRSDAAMQLTADIFGLPAARPHTYEASGLGAAMAVAVGLGFYQDFETAVKEMTRTERVFEPDPASRV
ncbi:MAG: FGGY-family carbohydrate kinase, partial [bacterium]